MRIVILGGGGIGSIVAAFFARAGHDVTLVTRGAHLEAVRAEGITVTGLAGFSAAVRAAEPADGECDAFVLSTKTPDTRGALAAVSGLRPKLSLSLQNGVAKDGVLAERSRPSSARPRCSPRQEPLPARSPTRSTARPMSGRRPRSWPGHGTRPGCA